MLGTRSIANNLRDSLWKGPGIDNSAKFGFLVHHLPVTDHSSLELPQDALRCMREIFCCPVKKCWERERVRRRQKQKKKASSKFAEALGPHWAMANLTKGNWVEVKTGLKEREEGPGCWGSMDWAPACGLERLLVWFPVRAHAWIAGQVPSWGSERGNYPLFLCTSCFSPFLLPFPSL